MIRHIEVKFVKTEYESKQIPPSVIIVVKCLFYLFDAKSLGFSKSQ